MRTRAGLDNIDSSMLAEVFSEEAGDGNLLDRSSFKRCMKRLLRSRLVSTGGVDLSRKEREYLSFALSNVFDAFDRNSNGVVDLREFVSGFGLLTSGSSFDKLALAFDLFDTDGDGCISRSEMQAYMLSFFTLVNALSNDDPGTTKQDASTAAKQAARDATQRCFDSADLDADTGGLSFSEFRMWYNSGEGKQMLPWVEMLSSRE